MKKHIFLSISLLLSTVAFIKTCEECKSVALGLVMAGRQERSKRGLWCRALKYLSQKINRSDGQVGQLQADQFGVEFLDEPIDAPPVIDAYVQWGPASQDSSVALDLATRPQEQCGNTPMAWFLQSLSQEQKNKKLVDCADEGNLTDVDLLLRAGANINSYDAGQTALYLAAVHGNEKLINFLLDRGADINLQDQNGNTALIGAACSGDRKSVV